MFFNRFDFDNHNRLAIFEFFVEDPKLKKKKIQAQFTGAEGSNGANGNGSLNVFTVVSAGSPQFTTGTQIVVAEQTGLQLTPKSWGQKFWEGFLDLLRIVKAETTRRMSVEQFFRSVKNSAEELQVIGDRARGYELAMKNAQENGQVALYEQLKNNLEAARSETQLISIGFNKYLTEETLVQFIKQCKKGLRLDWMKNFTRVIPPEVVEKKNRVDELGVFDNYVILHYDPTRKSWAETQEERDRRKDPILFGVISGQRKLYYVADWIDEVCDLTLDQIADQMGKESISTLK